MRFWLIAIIQWLHVFFAIFWFGATLTIDFMVVPVAQRLPPAVGAAFGAAFGRRAPQVILPVAVATVVLGAIRGIAGGVLGNLGSLYGLTWIAAFVLGIGILLYGMRVLTPASEQLAQLQPGPEFVVAVNRLKRLALAELGGFAILLVLMIAMRFGY